MAWRGVLRVVDFERLLTAQAILGEFLERAGKVGGSGSPESQSVREGFNLLAKVLFTRRAGISDLHDLVWLDHVLVSRDARPAKVWEGDESRTAWERLSSGRGRLEQLAPRQHASAWAQVPIEAFGAAEPLRIECGRAGRVWAGVVPHDEVLELLSELGGVAGTTPPGNEALEEIRRLGLAVRQEARVSAALAFAASDL